MADHRQLRTRLSYWKKIVYALGVTTLFFLFVEGLLTLAEFEPSYLKRDPFVDFTSRAPLFVEQTQDAGEYFQTAERKLAFFNSQRFPKTKPANTIRIFCLGGSTTFGRPYDDTTCFAGWLRELLPSAAGNPQYEVINAGGISYASYRVAATMEELCEHDPDAFIVYTGHNEFLEERTYRDHQTLPAGIRQLNSLLHLTRTYSLAHSMWQQRIPPAGSRCVLPGEVDTILDHASGPAAYRRDDELRANILGHFAFNLARMVELARAAGAKIVFVTPASNLKDFSPFKSEFSDGLPEASRQHCLQLLATSAELEKQGDPEAALAALEQATAIDGRLAMLHFRAGRLLFELGRFTEARAAFLRAIDQDVCPLRAVPEMQQIVARIAMDQQVPLIDFDAILKRECLSTYGHESPGHEYFLDHVHPTIEAHRLLSLALIHELLQEGVVTTDPAWREEEAIALATQRIESRVDDQLHAQALTNLAQVLSWAGKQELAGPIAVEAVRLRSEQGLAEDPESMFYAAVHLAMTGQNAGATGLLKKVIAQEPSNVAARWRLATLLYDQLRYDEATHHFQAALKLDPTDADSHRMLGLLFLRSGHYQDALASLQRAVTLNPDDELACIKIAATWQELGRDQDAIKWYRRVIELNRESVQAHRQLSLLFLKRGRPAEAIESLQRVQRLDPHHPGIIDDLRRARRELPKSSRDERQDV